ncbi:MAG: sterol desaturase family protein [Silicimonas sp.]|nr:sterol desaturase family protein [Silicimonas sp.]
MIPTLRILIHMGALQRLFPLWLIGIGLMIAFWTPWLILALVYGVLMQFFVEYVMHRFLFHREPPQKQGPFNALYRSHIGHHEFPLDPEFFTGDDHWFPVRFGLASLLLQGAILGLIFGWAGVIWSAVAIFAGSISAFAFYEYCHTLAHLNVPKGWFGRRITQTHFAHHFQDHHATFHVSFGMGWIDRLFGTAHDKATARARYDRKTLMSLGMDPEDLRLVVARKTYGLPEMPRMARGREKQA